MSEVLREFPQFPTYPLLYNLIAALIAIVAGAKYYAYAALTQLAGSQIQYSSPRAPSPHAHTP